MAEQGGPKMIVCDNGREFASNAILAWTDAAWGVWHYIAPGKPMQNAYIERLTAACAMSLSMRRCSRRSAKPELP